MITRLLAPALVSMAERGHLPDALIRHGIRRLCASRLQTLVCAPEPARAAAEDALRDDLARRPGAQLGPEQVVDAGVEGGLDSGAVETEVESKAEAVGLLVDARQVAVEKLTHTAILAGSAL